MHRVRIFPSPLLPTNVTTQADRAANTSKLIIEILSLMLKGFLDQSMVETKRIKTITKLDLPFPE